jgi:hypothetical protein
MSNWKWPREEPRALIIERKRRMDRQEMLSAIREPPEVTVRVVGVPALDLDECGRLVCSSIHENRARREAETSE